MIAYRFVAATLRDGRAEAIDELCAEYAADPGKVAEADEWNDGTQSGDHYTEVEIALADLHAVDASALLGSDVLVRLYRLAKAHGQARAAQLQEMAEDEIERRTPEHDDEMETSESALYSMTNATGSQP